jgi:hypothetical protein
MVVEAPWPGRTTVSGGEGEQLVADGTDDGGEVRERAPCGSGPSVEEGVAGEDRAQFGCVEADRSGGVSGGVQHDEFCAGHGEAAMVGQVAVRGSAGVRLLPQEPVVQVEQDGCSGPVGQGGGGVDVVVVGVRAYDGDDAACTDGGGDLRVVVCRVDHDDLVGVAEDPDVVVDLPCSAVQGERP